MVGENKGNIMNTPVTYKINMDVTGDGTPEDVFVDFTAKHLNPDNPAGVEAYYL